MREVQKGGEKAVDTESVGAEMNVSADTVHTANMRGDLLQAVAGGQGHVGILVPSHSAVVVTVLATLQEGNTVLRTAAIPNEDHSAYHISDCCCRIRVPSFI